MVASKDKIRLRFAERLDEALTKAGAPAGSGRRTWMKNRYGVSVESARKWLSGISLPDAARMLVIAEDLHVAAEWLLTGNGVPPGATELNSAPLAPAGSDSRQALQNLVHNLYEMLEGHALTTVEEMAEHYEVNPVRLANELQEMDKLPTATLRDYGDYLIEHVAEVAISDSKSAGETPAGYIRLPLLNLEGSMGHGTINDEQPEVVKFLDVAEWWAKQHLPHNLKRLKIISSRGDSNAGLINHGDIVFVDTGTDHFDGEGLYVFNWNGRALIKRLAVNIRTGKLQIQSANPAYPPEEISVGEVDQLHIAGRVSKWWTLRDH